MEEAQKYDSNRGNSASKPGRDGDSQAGVDPAMLKSSDPCTLEFSADFVEPKGANGILWLHAKPEPTPK